MKILKDLLSCLTKIAQEQKRIADELAKFNAPSTERISEKTDASKPDNVKKSRIPRYSDEELYQIMIGFARRDNAETIAARESVTHSPSRIAKLWGNRNSIASGIYERFRDIARKRGIVRIMKPYLKNL